MSKSNFTVPLLNWFQANGRQNLPWQHPRTPYRVWVSEIMLQQTQVKTVIPYFERFITYFPDVYALASSSEDEVLAHWSGLGYYSRARNLHKTAYIICRDFQGKFPDDLSGLMRLPGIGASTAAAIISLAFNKPAAILDSNVKRILSRYFLVSGSLEQTLVKQKLMKLANDCMSDTDCADYTQAIMDLGAICCTIKNPDCPSCPLQSTCLAKQHNMVNLYPHKKVRKTKPLKEQQFLLLHTNNKLIYLEKRPPIGLWGGLWCMPIIEKTQCPLSYLNQAYPLQVEKIQELMSIKHTFSHFHLHIKALSIKINRLPDTELAEYSGRWLAFNEINNLGLAKPVSRIIDYFFS